MLPSCDLPVFISKISECNQVEFSAGFLDDLANFNSLCSTWMVSDPFFAFLVSYLKLCYNDFSCSIIVSRSSPISTTSPSCIIKFDATCQVLQQFLLYHCPLQHSALMFFSQLLYIQMGRALQSFLFLGFFCPCILANKALGPYRLSELV